MLCNVYCIYSLATAISDDNSCYVRITVPSLPRRFILDKLGGVENGITRDVFCGELCTNTQCTMCGHMSSKGDTFLDLGLPMGEGYGWPGFLVAWSE